LKFSKLFLPTLKETPSEAEVISHKYMLRAGLIRKLAAGIYSVMPLGVRVLRKIENIIRQEMNRAGAQEVFLPSIQPSELWRESGRWDFYGKELLRVTDRHGREFCYGPTAEEVITDLVRNDVRSYRDLPLNLYQIQTKFRDEIRPRFGVMRGREFSMKDAYSFDADEEGAEESYRAMKKAYEAIFLRCGLRFSAVEADTGQIGGSSSHEFMVLADSGEDTIVHCQKCGYAANVERSRLPLPPVSAAPPPPAPMEEVATPGMGAVEDVAEFLKRDTTDFIKTLIFKTGLKERPLVAALCRGDHEINHVKLARAIGCAEASLAEEADVVKATGAPVGFAGAPGLAIPVVADNWVRNIVNAVTGANKADTHIVNVNPERDFPEGTEWADIRQPQEGDLCPECAAAMGLAKGIEVGHIFKLGTKYSESMNATFLDAEGEKKPMIMGCFGIGVGRTAAAAIEQNHDDDGIMWPMAIAPFKAIVLPLNIKDSAVMDVAESIYHNLDDSGLEPLLDDRNARAGVKFNDADLIGIPLQVIVGKKGVEQGKAEIKIRATGEKLMVDIAETPARVAELVKKFTP